MGRIGKFLKHSGIKLYTPKGWAQLITRTARFSKKHKGHVLQAMKEKIKQSETVRENIFGLSYAQTYALASPKQGELGKLALAVPSLKKQYTFSVIVMTTEEGEALDELLWDLKKQIYPAKQVVLCSAYYKEPKKRPVDFVADRCRKEFVRVESAEVALSLADGDYVVFLSEGDRVERTALFELCFELNRAGKAFVALYTDHDTVLWNKDYVDPYYKPGWSPDLFLANDYIRNSVAFKKEALERIIPDYALSFPLFVYDLLLKISETGEVSHLAGAFFHLTEDRFAEDYSPARNKLREAAIARRGVCARVNVNEYFNTSIEYEFEGEPLVSIIIPTCYTQDYIERCISSIYEKSTYNNYEIIVVDNSRKHPNYGKKRLKKLMQGDKCRILYVNEPFNWARLNNLAAKEAKGEFFLFLNDDTEIITPDWLQRMAAEAARSDIGEVGSLLLFPDGKVQHAGVFLVDHGGGARHFYQFDTEKSKKYHDFLHYRRECTFLTGACIMVERKKFDILNGFDENFAVVSNDFDFGVRLRNCGYRNLYLPDVKLLHKEKVSRSDQGESEGEKYAWSVWGTAMDHGDEYFNVYLEKTSEIPSLSVSPVRHILSGSPSIEKAIINKIIVVKLDHIGDNIIDLPAVRKLRKLFPDARIDMLCAPWMKNFWEEQPEVDVVFTYEFFTQRSQDGVSADEKELKELMSALKKEHYDLSVHLRRHEETKKIAEAIADYCLTFSTDAENDSCSHAVPSLKDIAKKKLSWSMHDQMLSLVRNLECEPELDVPFAVSAEAEEKAEKYIKTQPLFSAPVVIGIHAGSGGDNRQWGELKFGRLCNLILEQTQASVILFGGKSEIPINAKILEYVTDKSRVVSVAGQHSLSEFCALVKYVDYFIGNNSGPKHISGIQGVPTISIDGPSEELEWSAPSSKHMTVRKVLNCCPCYFYLRSQCPYDRLCLDRLGPGDVWRALERLMLLYPKHKGEQNG